MTEGLPGPPRPESRYIEASERCPHPERWSSTDGDSTEVEVSELIAGLVVGLKPDLVVETGAAFGQTTVAIAKALDYNGGGRLVALEADPERVAYARGRLFAAGFDQEVRAEVMWANSLTWIPAGGASPIDLLFSDSNYEHRVPEFLHLRPYIRDGAVVIFHDTAPERGAHRIASERDLRSEIEAELVAEGLLLPGVDLPTPRGLSIFRVP